MSYGYQRSSPEAAPMCEAAAPAEAAVSNAQAQEQMLAAQASGSASASSGSIWDTIAGGASDLWHGATNAVEGAASSAYHAATDWHFEGRQAHNGPAPSQGDLDNPENNWQELPPSMAVFHDNHEGLPEHKYVNPDGRESVKDGDTGQEVTDPRYMATYNYVTPMAPSQVHGVGSALEFAARGVGHLAADVLPYAIGGNVRGPG